MFDKDGLRYIPDNVLETTLKGVIEKRCALHPRKTAINYLHDGELDIQEALSYSELDIGARAILGELRNCAKKGDRALLLFPSGNQFLLSFVACLYGGIVAVPVAFPGRRSLDWERVFAIVNDCGASVILSFGEHLKKVESRFKQDFGTWQGNFIDVAEIPSLKGINVATTDINGDDLAFLQYTSGSTGAPKGVMVSHDNLFHNQRILQTGFKNSASTRYVSWLPLFHDMGLIGCALQSLYLGVDFNYMAPAAFLQRPLRWIKAVSHFRATTSGAPNFAYELCAARYSREECKDVELSAWQCAFNGAEPVRPSTLDIFYKTYATHGLTHTAQYPCYGLAEGVLMVSGGISIAPAKILQIKHSDYLSGTITPCPSEPNPTILVGVGAVVGDQTLAIVDPKSCERAKPGAIGEIWLSGHSVARGYWQKTKETKETFLAKIDGELDGKAYLRTGDTGYLDDQGELYITGRIKDTIIINGKNYFPQDIEHIVETSDEALKVGGGAVFSIEHEGQEKIVVLQEVRRSCQKSIDCSAIIKKIRQRVASECELSVHDVCLLKPTTLLKTTSGKVQRQRNKGAYLDGDLSIVDRYRSVPKHQSPDVTHTSDEIFDTVHQWLTHQSFGLANISASNLFIDVGMTSVDAISLAEHLSTLYGQRIDSTLVWEFPEIGNFCNALSLKLGRAKDEIAAPKLNDVPNKVNVYELDSQEFHALLEKELAG